MLYSSWDFQKCLRHLGAHVLLELSDLLFRVGLAIETLTYLINKCGVTLFSSIYDLETTKFSCSY